MFVVIEKPRLQRLIAVTRDDRTPRQQGRDQPFYRIEASGQSLRLTGREVEVTISATVHEPGVVFLRVTTFRKALAMLPESGFITLQANSKGLVFGDTRLSPEVVDMLLYPNTTTAPMLHPEERASLPEHVALTEQLTLFEPRESAFMNRHPTTAQGFENVNRQRNDGCLNVPGSDHNNVLYRMTCLKCLHVYAANGSDIHHRKCPKCQGGQQSSGGWGPHS